jgi:uncharacterized protein (DUF1501 family)
MSRNFSIFTPSSGSAPSQPCSGPSRRAFLKVGFLGGLGLTLGDCLQLQAQESAAPAGPAAQSVIFIYMGGGMSHIDTFDPKPFAPIEYRGELGSVKTNTGEYFGGQLKNLAKVADKMAVVRSMTHGEAAHERGQHNMLTGYRPSPAIKYPSFGSVVSHKLGSRNNIPPYVGIPNANNPFMGTGYMSSAYGSFSVGGEPNTKGFKVRDLNLPAGVTPERMDARKNLLASVDAHFNALENSDALDAMNSYYQRAYSLISSQDAREAFNIDAEEAKIRDEYGRSSFGQRLLLARRLVEGGARFITVSDGGWDMHKGIKKGMEGKFPSVDKGLATLIRDLDRRGLLATTLVVQVSEFGRTAKLNKDGGRDHWPKAFSVALAGGGVKGGIIHGATNAQGTEPSDAPVGPADLGATIYTQLGIDPTERLMSPGNRPIDIIRNGNIIQNIV